ncbi:hypothetical protein P3X46_006549 [Hevea brasiliensis]|uniref:Zinc finger CCCH domain-containing protein 18-like n=1 Tax=Hevea brasiliensis TaxID=3981 RepID=A0ABQ9MQJ9_HEVBR|nr:zinc finger CCCH domain-containing protein 18 [Hevea brasiliensis]KAJ9182566.1 hypothetical protein P3X46_006549 [Hevea brasiliensis]KAJ9182567.1 hypothetical protein P3X46_006549 [Hevea brasiliensis]
MDFSEHTRIVFNRIKKLEPENVTKIIGYLLLQDGGDQEMINLAMSPDVVIQEVIYKAKAELNQLALKSATSPISPSMNSPPVSSPFAPFFPVSSRSFLSPAAGFRPPSSYWESQVGAKHNSDFASMGYLDSVSELQNQTQFLSLEDQIEPVNLGNMGFPSDYFNSDAAVANLSARACHRYSSLNDFPVKTCHYFNKGFCKHGSNCRYYHGQVSESFPRTFDAIDEDQIFSPGSLKKLELEIIELLKSRKGNPVSIASLPMIYYEKYGKVLQAEGYLTESQRHGKAGYSLTKLLARLKNSIRLIDRPHGQHAVMLAEDIPKYMENWGDRNDPGPIVSGSRQIYLTFPAESTFTEDDVSNYFNTFGPVEDVRIPCQQKRMFGFVTFESADTVKMILAKGNPHFVCGARVLVKPYREKSKLIDRKYQERIEPPMYFSSQYVDMDSELHPMPRGYETSRLLRKQLMEEQDPAFEFRRRQLAELQMPRKPMSNHSYFGYSLDGLKVSEDNFNLPSTERFSCQALFDALNSGSVSDDKFRHTETNYMDPDSQGLNLPESPFASPIASSISTVI